MLETITIIVALLYAANIGASGSATSMGEVYGSGAISKRLVALGVVAVAVIGGALLAGSEVTQTLSDGVVSSESLTMPLALVMLIAATVPLAAANLLGIPLSTSEVAVGALVGIGVAVGAVNYEVLALIIAAWITLPFLAFLFSAIGTKILLAIPVKPSKQANPLVRNVLVALLVAGGAYTAFAVGANNVANAIAPLVAVGIFTMGNGLLLGGVAVALGAVLLGGRVLHTSGKRITDLNLGTGILVSFVSGSLVLGASLAGLPVPLAQAKTGAIMGVGFGKYGPRALSSQVVRDIGTVWVLSPVISLLLAYFAAHIALDIGSEAFKRPLSYVLGLLGSGVIAGTLVFLNQPRLARSWFLFKHQISQAKKLVAVLASNI